MLICTSRCNNILMHYVPQIHSKINPQPLPIHYTDHNLKHFSQSLPIHYTDHNQKHFKHRALKPHSNPVYIKHPEYNASFLSMEWGTTVEEERECGASAQYCGTAVLTQSSSHASVQSGLQFFPLYSSTTVVSYPFHTSPVCWRSQCHPGVLTYGALRSMRNIPALVHRQGTEQESPAICSSSVREHCSALACSIAPL